MSQDLTRDGIPILAYHAQNISGNCYGQNDHISLAADLACITALGKRIVPLNWAVDWLLGERNRSNLGDVVCITFDDGCNLEHEDLEFPGYGLQRSFLNILKDFQQTLEEPDRPLVQATSFVLASAEARQQIDEESLFGHGWMTDDWWASVQAEGIIDIQNHGWDHLHPSQGYALPTTLHARFESINTAAACELQLAQSAEFISQRAGRSSPQFFAYPYGRGSAYLRNDFLPAHADRLGLRAAFSTHPTHLNQQSSRWNLPRYVCGRDWRSPREFEDVLNGVFAAQKVEP